MSAFDESETGSDSEHCYLNLCKEPDDFYTLLAASLMVAGIIFMTVGYVVPRDYEFNPFLPAREMEAIEIHFDRLSYNLDIVITVGMALVASGGMIMGGVMCYAMYTDRTEHDIFADYQTEKDTQLLRRTHYGSTASQDNISRTNLFEMNSMK